MYALVAVVGLFIAVIGLLAWNVLQRMRVPADVNTGVVETLLADRYRPMLRLLGDEDLDFVSGRSHLHRVLRAQRRQLFRRYLRCLARDYALLLAGVRAVMVQSGIDRPDLARALAKNRVLFAITLARVELRLALHAAGIGKVDISGLVDALESLRAQVTSLASTIPSAA